MPASITTQPSLTQEQVEQFLVRPLMATAQVLAAGPRLFDVQGATVVRVPKLVTYNLAGSGVGASAQYWKGENQLIDEADPETDEIRLAEGVASMKILHRYSNELARSSVVDYGRTFGDAIVRQLALELDTAFLTGDGVPAPGSGSPPLRTILGITNQPDTQEITGIGAPEVDDLFDAEGMAMAAEASPNVWFMCSRDFQQLRKQRTSTGEYLLQPDLSTPGTYRLLGRPVRISNRLLDVDSGESQIILADMAQVAVARDVSPTVTFLTERYADYDQQAIRVVCRYDLGLLNPAGVIVLRGVTTP